MPDYMKMYSVLCKAIDDVIDPLERIPLAQPSAEALKSALYEAEEIYMETWECQELCANLICRLRPNEVSRQ